MDNPLALVLSPAYVEGLDELSMDDVRARRTICQRLEAGHSLLRRIIQGRLDIVGSEIHRRQHGAAAPPVSGDNDLIRQLPEILSEPRASNSPSRPPTTMEPELIDDALSAELEAAVSPQQLSALGEVADADLAEASEALSELERRVSEQRRALHERIDVVQAEVMRRYRTGEVSVDSLLQ